MSSTFTVNMINLTNLPLILLTKIKQTGLLNEEIKKYMNNICCYSQTTSAVCYLSWWRLFYFPIESFVGQKRKKRWMPLETNCNAVVMVTLKSPYRQAVEKGGGVPALLLQTTTDTLLSYICIKYIKNQHNSFFFYTGTLDNVVMHTISGCTRLKTKAHNCFWCT